MQLLERLTIDSIVIPECAQVNVAVRDVLGMRHDCEVDRVVPLVCIGVRRSGGSHQGQPAPSEASSVKQTCTGTYRMVLPSTA